MEKIIKYIFNSKIKYVLTILIVASVYLSVGAITYSKNTINDLSNSLLRLHVVANSDSAEDQNIKFLVRDRVLEYMNEKTINIEEKEDAINILNENLEEIKEIAINTLKENNFNYNVRLSIGNFLFPTKNYGDITLPEGHYDALRIELGDASGKNWWCVMFPPLCFVDVSSGVVPEESKENIQASITKTSYEVITSESDNSVNFKFKIVEIVQKWFNR